MGRQRRLAAVVVTVWVLGLLLLGLALPAAADNELIRIDTDSQIPVDIRADSVEYNDTTGNYVAAGAVELVRGDMRLLADRVELNGDTMVALAEGQVRLTTPEQIFTADRMVMDINNNTGKLYNGMVFLRSNHYYLRGSEMEKTGEFTYRVINGGFTPCDGSDPDWEITAAEMDVRIEGYGIAKSTAFRARDIPVLWTPYLMFPVKSKRESGFLMPFMASTEREGYMFALPWYQVISDDQDATFTVTYMEKRGFDLGVEYRVKLSADSRAMVMFDYLPNDDAAKDLYESGDLAEPYEERWWMRAKADHKLFNKKMNLKVDIDLVSDQDYLREFKDGATGYKLSNRSFDRMFGRELDTNTQLTRTNRVNLSRQWASASFNGTVKYIDNLNLDQQENQFQSLPNLTFDATRQPVGQTGLYFSMGSSYTYWWREQGSSGHISDLSPSVALPLNFNDYLESEPSLTLEPRFYSVKLDDGEDPDHSTSGATFRWKLALGNSTYLYKIFDLGSAEDPVKVKHTFRPYFNYVYKPRIDDDDVAELAQRDDQARVSKFTYGVNNTLVSKIMGKDEETGEVGPIYREFLRLSIGHSFNLDDYLSDDEEENSRPFGTVEALLEFDPVDWLYFQTQTYWNPNKARMEYLVSELTFTDFRGDSIGVDYTYIYDDANQVNLRLRLAITKEWSLRYVLKRELDDEITFEQTFGVDYESQCWGIRAFYTDQYYHEQGYWVVLSLKGFGDVLGQGQLTSNTDD